MSTRSTCSCGKGDTAPGSKPVAADHLLGPGQARAPCTCRAGDAAWVDTPVAGDERQHRCAVTDEHERLHDLAERATDRVGGILRRRSRAAELLETPFGAGRAHERGHALDLLRPLRDGHSVGSRHEAPADTARVVRIARISRRQVRLLDTSLQSPTARRGPR